MNDKPLGILGFESTPEGAAVGMKPVGGILNIPAPTQLELLRYIHRLRRPDPIVPYILPSSGGFVRG